MNIRIGVALGAVALVLAGCATGGPQTRVTRFSLNQNIARGQIAVEPLNPALRASPEFETYANLVAAQLAKLGFTEAPGLVKSEQVAAIAVEFGTQSGPPRRGAVIGFGVGGGSYGYRGGGGGGVGVSAPVGGGPGRDIALTRLIVQIKRRSDGTTVWEGRAETAAPVGSAAAQPSDAVARLANALFLGFPGRSGQTVVVK